MDNQENGSGVWDESEVSWTARPGTNDRQECPVRDVLNRLSDSWSLLVLLELSGGPKRFNQLRRSIGDISQRMLSVTLRHLERDGLVTRTVIPSNPPQVEYARTDLARSLDAPLGEMVDWARRNHAAIRSARGSYDERLEGNQ